MENRTKPDWKEIGLKAGLEIHQQLKTDTKLFCGCPIETRGEEKDHFERRLRPARSELGEIDIAAFFEWKKGMTYRYTSPRDNACLVEADEEPPHELNREAVIIALAMAKALKARPVDEIHVMRKIVIDGSNTTGFQRTALVAIGGHIQVDGKTYGIQTICVEEDASRKERQENHIVEYNLDRLGVPLIEISTAPDINTPEEAEKLAYTIGQMLRLTGKAKRGIGTIRQDLNISIRGGEKIEVKGVQELSLLPKVVENEAYRQLNLLKIRDEMRNRGITEEDLRYTPIDVTEILKNSNSRIVRKNLSKKNAKALAIKLSKMKGILGWEIQSERRFGTELADYARFWGDVKGLFHSDELPGYGIGEEEVEKIYSTLKADRSSDAFVIIIDEEEKAKAALEAVIQRTQMALKGVPKETRMALPDGTTKYMRPQPGAARMYPETDIPPLEVTEEMLNKAEKIKPVHPKDKIEEYIHKGLSRDLAFQVMRSEKLELIDRLIDKYGEKIEAKYIASVIIEHLKALKREGVPVDLLSEEKIDRIFELLYRGEITKEAVDEIIKLSAENPLSDPQFLAEKHGLKSMKREEIVSEINKLVIEYCNEILLRKEKAIGFMMGRAMEKLRGRAPGKVVAEVLRNKIKRVLEKNRCE